MKRSMSLLWKQFFFFMVVLSCLCFASLFSGCVPQKALRQPPRGNRGELLVYLAPLPPEVGPLSFSFSAVSAVGEDGAVYPLSLRLKKATGTGSDRQRLLATGFVPPGSYRGISVTMDKARMATENGKMDLLVPDQPILLATPFTIDRRGGDLLEVGYRHADSVREHVRFVPAFSLYKPDKPVASRLAFVSVPDEDYVLVFDRDTLKATDVFPLDGKPEGMALDEAGHRLFVALAAKDAIAVIDTLSGDLIGRIPLQLGDRPSRLALTENANLLVCVNSGSDSVSFLDPHSLVELDRVRVGYHPDWVTLDAGDQRAFIYNRRSDSISVLDLDDHRLQSTVPTDSEPFRGVLNGDGSRLYVIYRNSPYLNVLNPQTLAVLSRQVLGIGADSLLVDSRTDLIYLGWENQSHVDIIDPFSLQAMDSIDTVGGTVDMGIDDAENRLLVASQAGSVTGIDLVSKQQTGRVDTGGAVYSLVLSGARR